MSGYDGVMHAVSDNTEWRWTIRACFDWMDKEEARGSETPWIDEKRARADLEDAMGILRAIENAFPSLYR